MTGTEQAQMIGASALHEAQIIGVIDDAGKIGVLVIDPDGHDVPAGVDFAVKKGRERAHSNLTLRFTLFAAPQLRSRADDARRHVMAAAAIFAIECIHRPDARCSAAASQFLPSNGFGASSATSISSRQRALTSILSGSERGT